MKTPALNLTPEAAPYRPLAGNDATMLVGETYDYNFAGMPGGSGTFLGWTDFGWLVFRTYEADRVDGEVRFYNPALLCTLRPETWEG